MVPHTFPSLLTSSKLHIRKSKKKKRYYVRIIQYYLTSKDAGKKWIQITSALLFLGRGWETYLKKGRSGIENVI